MSALANVAASRPFAAPPAPRPSRSHAADAAALRDAVRPSRIGGAPLSGARAAQAYQRTATVESLTVLSRVDEYV